MTDFTGLSNTIRQDCLKLVVTWVDVAIFKHQLEAYSQRSSNKATESDSQDAGLAVARLSPETQDRLTRVIKTFESYLYTWANAQPTGDVPSMKRIKFSLPPDDEMGDEGDQSSKNEVVVDEGC
jgi:hypothetical protein